MMLQNSRGPSGPPCCGPSCNTIIIIITASYCYFLQLEMHVRLICAIKFYLYILTYLIIIRPHRLHVVHRCGLYIG